jgi:hypothetical protein
MKKYFTVGFFALLCVSVVQAQEEDFKEAFTQKTNWSAKTLSVPAVVEVPVSSITNPTFAVYERETGTYIPNYYHVVSTKKPIAVSASSNMLDNAYMLVDGKYDTMLDAPLPEQGQGAVVIALKGEQSVTSSEIIFSFAPHVARPLYVSLSIIGTDGSNERIVSKKRYTSDRLAFPKTKADTWFIEFVYAQPLRISEVSLLQEDVEKTTSRSLRFLAQPLFSYDIYLNPDRSVYIPVSEAGDLYTNKGVQRTSVAPAIEVNPAYIEADGDVDGVPDRMDNCITVANADQVDVDGNQRGDVCDDYDRDGIINATDNCPNNPNTHQADEDADGVGDVCDKEDNRLTEKYSWIPWVGLGFAVLVLIAMFLVVLRRKPEVSGSDDRLEE